MRNIPGVCKEYAYHTQGRCVTYAYNIHEENAYHAKIHTTCAKNMDIIHKDDALHMRRIRTIYVTNIASNNMRNIHEEYA